MYSFRTWDLLRYYREDNWLPEPPNRTEHPTERSDWLWCGFPLKLLFCRLRLLVYLHLLFHHSSLTDMMPLCAIKSISALKQSESFLSVQFLSGEWWCCEMTSKVCWVGSQHHLAKFQMHKLVPFRLFSIHLHLFLLSHADGFRVRSIICFSLCLCACGGRGYLLRSSRCCSIKPLFLPQDWDQSACPAQWYKHQSQSLFMHFFQVFTVVDSQSHATVCFFLITCLLFGSQLCKDWGGVPVTRGASAQHKGEWNHVSG